MIFGTLFKSATTFIQVMIDPNEFLALQTSIMASLNNINTNVLLIAFIIIIAIIPFIYDEIKYLDVLSLGKEQAINLGVDFDKAVKNDNINSNFSLNINSTYWTYDIFRTFTC